MVLHSQLLILMLAIFSLTLSAQDDAELFEYQSDGNILPEEGSFESELNDRPIDENTYTEEVGPDENSYQPPDPNSIWSVDPNEMDNDEVEEFSDENDL
jgi:hypothetical protein